MLVSEQQLNQTRFKAFKPVMKKSFLLTGLLGLTLALSGLGCHDDSSSSTNPSAPAQTSAQPADAKPAVPIPADSPFAKIKVGMGMAEVYALIGQPTDTTSHITGKAFIPYYYGGDTHRVEALYKGQGRIVFAPPHAFTSDLQVLEIDYDPTERGYQ